MTLASVQNITRSIANSISLRTACASFTAITAAVSSKRGTVTVRKGATRDFTSTNTAQIHLSIARENMHKRRNQ